MSISFQISSILKSKIFTLLLLFTPNVNIRTDVPGRTSGLRKEARSISISIEDILTRLVMFRPVYANGANVTELMVNDSPSPYIDNRTVNTVKRALARCYAVDLAAQGELIRHEFHRHPPLPIYLPDNRQFNGGRVFIPLKMRRPRVAHDNAYGYVDVNFIRSIKPGENRVLLELTDGRQLNLYCSPATARANVVLGQDVQRFFYGGQNEDALVMEAIRIILHKLNRLTVPSPTLPTE